MLFGVMVKVASYIGLKMNIKKRILRKLFFGIGYGKIKVQLPLLKTSLRN
jgi:hypothetical protein